MVWLRADYLFASAFSYRVPGFSTSYAASCPCPGPSAVKLALISTAISRSGKVSTGIQMFESLKDAKVTFKPPRRTAVYRCLIRRLKRERAGTRLERTFGIREYAHFEEPLTLYVDVPVKAVDDVSVALKQISYLGTSDSICTCIRSNLSEPDEKATARPMQDKDINMKSGIIFGMMDFGPSASFDSFSPYSESRVREGKEILRVPYLFPLKVVERGRNYAIYAFDPLI
jgi:CRISPR-associated Cas5-like protein